MKMMQYIFVIFLLLFILVPSSQAQGGPGPLVIVHGEPDTNSLPEVRTHFSVIEPRTGKTIGGLTSENFQFREAGTDLENLEISQQSVGLAIVVVIDRRAISGPSDARLQKAIELVEDLIDELKVDGETIDETDDMIAVIGVKKNSVLEPETYFTLNADKNVALNALDIIAQERGDVGGYEGISVLAEINGEGYLKVLRAYEDGPAEEARLFPGDQILEVDGISIAGSTLQESADLICGPRDTKVKLLVQREGIPGPFPTSAIRSQVVVSGGIGISVEMGSEGKLRVTEVYKDLPAEQTGRIFIGDNILAVDDVSVIDSSPQEALGLIQGAPGKEVTLLIERVGISEPFEIMLTRAPVTICGRMVYNPSPPYKGLEEAVYLLSSNSYVPVRDLLSHRRKIIILLSGGMTIHYTDVVQESYLMQRANEADISIYPVGMARDDGNLAGEDHFRRIADQTRGLYVLYRDEKDEQGIEILFDSLISQRQQYLVAYETHQPRGSYGLDIEVDTDLGAAKEQTAFFSNLEVPEIILTAPAEGSTYTVPYSDGIGFEVFPIPLSVQVSSRDGVQRNPSEVHYFANGVHIGSSTEEPFGFNWNVSDCLLPIEGTKQQGFTLVAKAQDPYLGQEMRSPEVNIRVVSEVPKEISQDQTWLSENWWHLLGMTTLLVGEVVLFILVIRTRGEVARQVVSTTTGVLKGFTKRLGTQSSRAPGKLVVVAGANVGKEYRLAAHTVKVGRDPQFCDMALYDEFVSNPHFSVQMEQNKFFITDEGSTNGTKLSGELLQPNQRMPLAPDAIIEAGDTRLQFKRVGGTTRQLSGQQQAGAQQQQRGGPTKIV